LVIKEILELKTRYDKAIFCVGGDFNLPDIDWKTGLVNGNNYPHKTSEEIIKSGEDTMIIGSPITAINGIIIRVKL
jgi:hypothetical protein